MVFSLLLGSVCVLPCPLVYGWERVMPNLGAGSGDGDPVCCKWVLRGPGQGLKADFIEGKRGRTNSCSSSHPPPSARSPVKQEQRQQRDYEPLGNC